MKLATDADGTLDSRLMISSRDGRMALGADGIARSLLGAVQRWPEVEQAPREHYDALNARDAVAFDPRACAAPLPRAPQWLNGSAFLNHGRPAVQALPVLGIGLQLDVLLLRQPHVLRRKWHRPRRIPRRIDIHDTGRRIYMGSTVAQYRRRVQ